MISATDARPMIPIGFRFMFQISLRVRAHVLRTVRFFYFLHLIGRSWQKLDKISTLYRELRNWIVFD